MYDETQDPKQTVYVNQDLEDMEGAILIEMESRGLHHP